MAQRRMFSLKIVSSDAFLDMSVSARELYFQLGMYADDDGFINPKKIVRLVGASDDDLRMLLAKRFLLPFESGVVVIKHWAINNQLRKDFYQPTLYTDEKKLLFIKDNKAYTDRKQSVNKMLTTRKHSIDKISIDKIRLKDTDTTSKEVDKKISIKKEILESDSKEIPLIFKEFESINPAVKRMYGNKTQRQACSDLIKTYTFERVINVIKETLLKTNKIEYMPTITTPLQLMDKWSSLEIGIIKLQSKIKVANDKNNNYVG